VLRMGGRRRRRLSMAAEINITNLVDVAFVLLIIFMITAPILQGGIEVQLPEADATPLQSNEAVIVSVAANGDIFVEEVKVESIEELERTFSAYVSNPAEQSVMLKGDRNGQYGRVVEVLGVLKRLGVENVGFTVEPRPR
jgi:biopolymer transport protein TolR